MAACLALVVTVIGGPAPPGFGLWPASWLLGSDIDEVDWPASGEITVFPARMLVDYVRLHQPEAT